MLTMKTEETRHYVQTLKRLKNQYTSWAGSLRATERYAERTGHTSNDAIGNALWMWAKEQDPEWLAELLEPYVDQFQKMWEERNRSDPEEAEVNRTSVLGVEKQKRKKG